MRKKVERKIIMEVKTRQDAWTSEDDLLLAETVLKHVREGSTQLNAFEEVGDILNRTSAACGFRWNAVIRYKYEQALQLAKKYRKEKKRAENHLKTNKEKKNLLYTPPIVNFTEENQQEAPAMHTFAHPINLALEPEENMSVSNETPESTQSDQQTLPVAQREMMPNGKKLELGDIIAFLIAMKQQTSDHSFTAYENQRLKKEIHSLQAKNQNLEAQIKKLESEASAMHEDYDTLMKILNRARKLVLFDEEEGSTASTFKMDKNGNLEKVAD